MFFIQKRMFKNNTVVISGTGILSSLGYGIEKFKNALESGRTGIDFIEDHHGLPIKVGALIKDFSFNELLEQIEPFDNDLKQMCKKLSRGLPFSLQCSILAVLDAWHNAGLDGMKDNTLSKGIVIGGSNISQNYIYELHKKYGGSMGFTTPSYALHFMDTDHVGVLSELFQLKNEGFNVGGASASGNVALIKGMQMIKYGIADICVVVGTVADLSPLELNAFTNLNAIGGKKFMDKPKQASRPFDKRHEGFIYGQAAACIILENNRTALQRGIKPLGKFISGVHHLDANRLSNPSEDGEVNVMVSVLEQAGMQPEDIDYINAHGTSTPLGDITEINAIKKVFSKSVSDIYINSTKGITGHCLYSSGVVEAIASVIQMNHGFIHPNLNLDDPICGLCNFTRGKSVRANVKNVMSNSFGFGGINTSIILQK
ncbi:hypothetical protein G9F73_019500 [Clostridium estertheticum]|uniref:beta-ketoacyl synthase N-terminal-like domain-containing protein n=1 Tax=Clostridium estertheticum TaxID=238834 RepID=UPI0013EED1BC|nr:beta-ketoacyl synthase N-terminal-like domain-containing protein [Clostridium estertheticum]MBZ9609914.1 hypothetical protein [Clostridium estertheticum]